MRAGPRATRVGVGVGVGVGVARRRRARVDATPSPRGDVDASSSARERATARDDGVVRTRVVRERGSETPREARASASAEGRRTTNREAARGATGGGARARRRRATTTKETRDGVVDATMTTEGAPGSERGAGGRDRQTKKERARTRWADARSRARGTSMEQDERMSVEDERNLGRAIQALLRIEREAEILRDEAAATRIQATEALGAVEALALREKAAKQSKRLFEDTLALRLEYDSPAAMRAAEREGKMARKRLVTANMAFAASIARKLYDRIPAMEKAGMSRQDMVHEGATGLVRASELFDPSKGFRFTTYAHAWVRQAIVRGVHANGRTIRVPSHAHVLKKAAYEKQLEMQSELGRSATKEEIADSSSRFTVEMLEKFKDLSMDPLSLDANASQETDELDLASPDDAAELGPSDAVAREIERDFLRNEIRASLDRLPAPQAYVLRRRFGLIGDGPMTLAEIGAALNKTGEGVRYLEKKALENLKRQDGITVDGVTVSLAQHLDTSNDARASMATAPAKPKRRRAKTKTTTIAPSALDLVRSIDLA